MGRQRRLQTVIPKQTKPQLLNLNTGFHFVHEHSTGVGAGVRLNVNKDSPASNTDGSFDFLLLPVVRPGVTVSGGGGGGRQRAEAG